MIDGTFHSFIVLFIVLGILFGLVVSQLRNAQKRLGVLETTGWREPPMTKQKRKLSKSLRVPFKCNLAPATKELLTGIQNDTREPQGEIVDRAIALLALGEEVRSRKKPNKREAAIQARAKGDVVAQAVERDDIDYSDVESAPTVNVANLRGTAEAMSLATSKAVEKWRANRKPLLKPREQ